MGSLKKDEELIKLEVNCRMNYVTTKAFLKDYYLVLD